MPPTPTLITIDDLADTCGFFGLAETNNGYGCQSLENLSGECLRHECPIARPATMGDLRTLDPILWQIHGGDAVPDEEAPEDEEWMVWETTPPKPTRPALRIAFNVTYGGRSAHPLFTYKANVSLRLPTITGNEYAVLAPELVALEELFGDTLSPNWGDPISHGFKQREKSCLLYRPTREDLEAAVSELQAAVVAQLQRLADREAVADSKPAPETKSIYEGTPRPGDFVILKDAFTYYHL